MSYLLHDKYHSFLSEYKYQNQRVKDLCSDTQLEICLSIILKNYLSIYYIKKI